MKHFVRELPLLIVLGCSTAGSPERVAQVAPPVAEISAGLGRIDFPSTAPPAARSPFLRGVLLLHSFQYEDAAEAFREAQAAAPDFALAYWGEALTHSHPIWHEEDREQAVAVLERLAPSADERARKAGDERERGLLASVEALYGEGSRGERARAYSEALAVLRARYPGDLEIAAFHALSILGTATQGRDLPTYMRAAAVAEEVLERAPDHPGALHYAIHAYDDPDHAPLGLRMARRYGIVAAAAEHALHMPSHIYVALGMWPESIAANRASAAAADARRATKGLDLDSRGYHPLLWLEYSHLQLGEEAEAARLLADMRADAEALSSKRTRSHLVAMRAAYAVALEAWDQEIARFEVDLDGLDPAFACAELYVRGRAALARGDVGRAEEILAAMAGPRGPLETLIAEGASAAACCAPATRATYLPGRLAAYVMELELGGLIALAGGAEEDGLARLAAAAEQEDAMGFDYGPPVVVEPVHELLGDLLLERGRRAEAAAEFEAALRRAPGRLRSLRGLSSDGPVR
jgi:tetratricopeptide (TPR) repeat protein